MPEPVAAVEQSFDTDFAILTAAQVVSFGDSPGVFSYAASVPGVIAMVCGTKYASVSVRLERWDAPAPSADDSWEDRDEIPFRVLPGAGPLLVGGFDQAQPPGLDVDGLADVRVEILARGRHRYSYSSPPDDGLPPEEWLLRLWPVNGPVDPFAGPPRRIAGPLPFQVRWTAWSLAMHSWKQTGWASFMGGLWPAYYEIWLGLHRAARPVTREELAQSWGPWGPEREQHGAYQWDTPAGGFPRTAYFDTGEADERRQAVVAAAGLSSIDTFADVLMAMVNLGMVLRVTNGEERFAPNPSPSLVWERLSLTESQMQGLRLQIGYADFRSAQHDLAHMVEWSPDHRLVATPRRIAIRLAIHPEGVLGGIELLRDLGDVTLEVGDDAWGPDAEVAIQRKR